MPENDSSRRFVSPSAAHLADPDSRFMALNGLNVHYKMAGTGAPALVLLHGFGASVFSWEKVLRPHFLAMGRAFRSDLARLQRQLTPTGC